MCGGAIFLIMTTMLTCRKRVMVPGGFLLLRSSLRTIVKFEVVWWWWGRRVVAGSDLPRDDDIGLCGSQVTGRMYER